MSWNTRLASIGYISWEIDQAAPPIVRESVENAIRLWTEASRGVLRFKEGPGGIRITCDPSLSKSYFAYITFHDQVGKSEMSNVEIRIRTDLEWHRTNALPIFFYDRELNKERMNLDVLMLHEFGHALGLNHSDSNHKTPVIGCDVPDDPPTMQTYLISTMQADLHIDDIAGIQFLYPGSDLPPPATIVVKTTRRFKFSRFRTRISFSLSDGSDAYWFFGDGSLKKLSKGGSIIHKYNKPGIYNVAALSSNGVSQLTLDVLRRRP